jgi:hypothetical protein
MYVAILHTVHLKTMQCYFSITPQYNWKHFWRNEVVSCAPFCSTYEGTQCLVLHLTFCLSPARDKTSHLCSYKVIVWTQRSLSRLCLECIPQGHCPACHRACFCFHGAMIFPPSDCEQFTEAGACAHSFHGDSEFQMGSKFKKALELHRTWTKSCVHPSNMLWCQLLAVFLIHTWVFKWFSVSCGCLAGTFLLSI